MYYIILYIEFWITRIIVNKSILCDKYLDNVLNSIQLKSIKFSDNFLHDIFSLLKEYFD